MGLTPDSIAASQVHPLSPSVFRLAGIEVVHVSVFRLQSHAQIESILQLNWTLTGNSLAG